MRETFAMWFMIEHPVLFLVGFPFVLFLGMLVALELGRRAGVRRLAKDPGEAKARLGAVEGAIFGLLGLLIAFTFSGAVTRYDKRRELVVLEANALSDAWTRLDLLPPGSQPSLRDGLRRYLEARIETYRRVPNIALAMDELRQSAGIRDGIWRDAVAACATPEGQRAEGLVLPALNAAFNVMLVRTAAGMQHPPVIIFVLLFLLALASAMIAGYGMTGGKRRNWTYMVGFAAAMSVAVYAILDIEFPRIGIVRVDVADHMLQDVLDRMK